MTRIKASASALRQLIRAHDPTWLKRAREQTKAIEKGDDDEFPPLWSEIKEVYVELQGGERGGKCAYCEKWLEADKIEHDVEHFRPKARVARWNVPDHLLPEFAAAGVRVIQPERGSEPGYRLLAYHILNYATVCKECNSVLKRDLFPITGERRSDAKDPAKLGAEGALLIYPLGDFDADPEELIEFSGISPQAKAASGLRRLRALVTIEIFGLDGWRRRKPLICDRANQIEHLWFALRLRDQDRSAEVVGNATAAVDRLTSATSPHANCLRSFKQLYERNPDAAKRLYKEAIKPYLKSNSAGAKRSSR